MADWPVASPKIHRVRRAAAEAFGDIVVRRLIQAYAKDLQRGDGTMRLGRLRIGVV
jgi:hypothetical protein